jgi:hypothetical protein
MKKIFIIFCLLHIATSNSIEKTFIDHLKEHNETHQLLHAVGEGFIAGIAGGTIGSYRNSIFEDEKDFFTFISITSLIDPFENARRKKEPCFNQLSLSTLERIGCIVGGSMASYLGTKYIITQMIDFCSK